MAHFAKISETNEVLAVLTVDNKDVLNADGVEDENAANTQYVWNEDGQSWDKTTPET